MSRVLPNHIDVYVKFVVFSTFLEVLKLSKAVSMSIRLDEVLFLDAPVSQDLRMNLSGSVWDQLRAWRDEEKKRAKEEHDPTAPRILTCEVVIYSDEERMLWTYLTDLFGFVRRGVPLKGDGKVLEEIKKRLLNDAFCFPPTDVEERWIGAGTGWFMRCQTGVRPVSCRMHKNPSAVLACWIICGVHVTMSDHCGVACRICGEAPHVGFAECRYSDAQVSWTE